MLKTLLLLLALSRLGSSAITAIASASSGCDSATTCTTTSTNVLTITSTTAGSLIVVGVGLNNASVSSVTDSAGQAYTAVSATVTWNFTARAVRLFYKANSTSGVTTVTATASAASDIVIIQKEYAGTATTSPVDVQGSTTSPGCSGNCATVTATVVNAGGVGFIMGGPADTAAVTAGTGFTMVASVTTSGSFGAMRFGAADNLTIGTGSQAAAINFASAQGQAGASFVVFKAAASASTPIHHKVSSGL